MLTAMIASAEIDPYGDVWFNRPLGDQRFLEPNSGLYWQISGEGHEPLPSRSLWDRTLEVSGRIARERADLLRFAPVSRRAAARDRADHPRAGQRHRLAVHRRRRARRARRADPPHPLDPRVELRGARHRPVPDGDGADLVRPRPAAPRAPGDRAHPHDRRQPRDRPAAAGSPADGRGAERAARAFGQAGRGSAHPRRQPRARAQDPAHRADQRRQRARARPRRDRAARGGD